MGKSSDMTRSRIEIAELNPLAYDDCSDRSPQRASAVVLTLLHCKCDGLPTSWKPWPATYDTNNSESTVCLAGTTTSEFFHAFGAATRRLGPFPSRRASGRRIHCCRSFASYQAPRG